VIRLTAVTKRDIPKPLPTALDIWTTSNVKPMQRRTSLEAPCIAVRVWGEEMQRTEVCKTGAKIVYKLILKLHSLQSLDINCLVCQ
jgi:hypothetical protein